MKTMRKISALILALVMVLAMNAMAFAEIGTGGVDDTNNNNTLTFTKSILMKNKNASTVREPNITYVYTITDAGISGKTVTDEDGYVGQVYSIEEEGTAFASVLPTSSESVTFTDTATSTTSEDGIEDGKSVTFTFDGSKFPHAGIYRFKIAETISGSTTRPGVGITQNDNYATDMYLDVYVTGEGGTNSIYGYVMFEQGYNTDIERNEDASAHQKSEGWSGGSAANDYVNQDIYETYDLEVTKTTQGDSVAQNHNFPFSIVLGGSATTNKIDIAVTNGNLTGDNVRNLASGNNTIAAALRNEGKLTITGIPSGTATTINVTETNDTSDVYTVSSKVNDGEASAPAAKQNNDTLSTGDVAVAVDNLTKQTVAFTNTLTMISPTGYVTRYAPYGLILIAGIALLIVAKKHRKHGDEEEE